MSSNDKKVSASEEFAEAFVACGDDLDLLGQFVGNAIFNNGTTEVLRKVAEVIRQDCKVWGPKEGTYAAKVEETLAAMLVNACDMYTNAYRTCMEDKGLPINNV